MQDVFELAIYAGEFTNLELLRKGLYRLEFLAECNGAKAVPCGSLVAPSRLTSLSRGVECEGSDAGVEPGWIDEATCKYYTRSMYCRYMDESFHVGECILFRLTLPRTAWYSSADKELANVHVTIRLLRAEWGVPVAPPSAAQKQLESRPGPTSPLVYQRLSAFESASERRVSFPLALVHADGDASLLDAYAPIVFDSMNLCLVGLSCHSCLVSSSFDPTLISPSQLAGQADTTPDNGDTSISTSTMANNIFRWGTQAGVRAGNGVRSWLSSFGQAQGSSRSQATEDPNPGRNVLNPSEAPGRDSGPPLTIADWLFGDSGSALASPEALHNAHTQLLQPFALCFFAFAERFILVPEVAPCAFRPLEGASTNSFRFARNVRRVGRLLLQRREEWFASLNGQAGPIAHGRRTHLEGLLDEVKPSVLPADALPWFDVDGSNRAPTVDELSCTDTCAVADAFTKRGLYSPFCLRAKAIAADTGAVSDALMAEQASLEGLIALQWRMLQRRIVHSFGECLESLQCVFWAAATADLLHNIPHRKYPISCLTDPDAAGPWKIIRHVKRPTCLERSPCNTLRLVECYPAHTGASPLGKTLAITRYTYGNAEPSPSSLFARHSCEAFSDDSGDDSVKDAIENEPIRREHQEHVALRRFSVASANLSSAPGQGSRSEPALLHIESVPLAEGDSAPSPSTAHVVIFLNGLGGTTHDTRLIRSYLKLLHPHLFCLVTTSNQSKATEGDIIDAAARVAKEMHEMLSYKLMEEGLTLRCWSVVAFSLGGVVARLALRHPLLQPFLHKAGAFVSIASPHMGLIYAQSAVVSAGMYLFRQIRSSRSLAQLSFTDEDTTGECGIRNCLMYLLACGWTHSRPASPSAKAISIPAPSATVPEAIRIFEAESLHPMSTDSPMQAVPTHESSSSSESGDFTEFPLDEPQSASVAAVTSPETTVTLQLLRKHHFRDGPGGEFLSSFKRIVLVGSEQDSYAPVSSCLAHWCDAALADGKNGGAYGEMLRGFVSSVAAEKIQRWDVNFLNLSSILSGKITLDGVLGREAHVAFLETEQLALAISSALYDVWDIDE